MSYEQGATRFRSTAEEEDDAVIQMAYSRVKTRKNKGLIYLICVIAGIAIGSMIPFAFGATISPFLYPIWPLLLAPLLAGIIGLGIGMFMNYRVVQMAESEMDRANDIKRFSNGALMVMVAGLVFTVLFASIAMSPWLTNLVDQNIGTYNKPVMGMQAQDFELTPNDPLYITRGDLDIRVLSNNTKCDFFVGDIGAFENISDPQNTSAVEAAGLKGGAKYNTSHYTYDGRDFKPGKSYVARVNNYRSSDDISVKIVIRRAIDQSLLWGLIVMCVIYVALGGLGFGMMQALRVPQRARPTAPPAGARAPPARDAAAMFQGIEEEVQTMFPARPAGAQPRPGWGQAPGRPAARPGPPGPGEPGARPGAPAREIAVERPAPQGVQKSIVCPRCRNRFAYTKIEGQVTDIQCPNCGKRGRVGAKTAPPTPAAAVPTRGPPPRPATEPRLPPRPAGPTRPPKPAPAPKPAVSPLDEIIGSPAAPRPAGGKTKTLACPKCKQKFTVVEKPRPFEIKCPHCGKTGMLR